MSKTRRFSRTFHERLRQSPHLSAFLFLCLAGIPVAVSSAAGPGKSAPKSTTLPSISGSAVVGAQLSADAGVWSGPTPSFSIAWQRCNASGAACAPLGVSASSYTAVSGDAGSTLRIVVFATNKNGSTSATSAQTAVVAGPASPPPPPPGTFNVSPLPSISGTAQSGQTLTGAKGTWTPAPTNYGYQWSRCNSSGSSCAPVSGATGSTYALVSGDVGSTFRFAVTGSASGVTTATATSPQTAVVSAPAPPAVTPPANTTLPSVSGTPQVGNALNASQGAWTGSPTSFAYQWKRCDSSGGGCNDIGNATGSSYTPVSGDAGATVRVTVAATNAGGTTLAVSSQTATVAAAPSSPPPPPSSGFSEFGLSSGWQLPWLSATDQTKYLSSNQSMGVGILRFDINWTSIQAGGPTSYNWAPQDAIVKGAQAHGMQILGTIAYTPTWARPSGTSDKTPPTNNSDYGNFCKATAQHFSPMGVHAYEVWNEPNTGGMFAGASVSKYTAMLKLCYTAIKSVDPNSTVVTGGTAPAGKYNSPGSSSNVNGINWLEGIYANGGKGYFDAVGHHPYSYPYDPSTQADWSAWYQMFGTSPSLRSVMAANGDGGKKIWATEWGAPTNGPSGSGYVSESTQAAQVAQAFKLWSSYTWAGPLFVYDFRDDGTSTSTKENFFGLLRNDWSQKPAFAAYKSAAGK